VTSKSQDARTWLRANGHEQVARKIDSAIRKWAREGKKTRRNWWDILAGDKEGNPRKVRGILFPVLEVAKRRQRVQASVHNGVSRRKVTRISLAAKVTSNGSRRAAVVGEEARLPKPKPFVKWAGGKRQLLAEILKHVPDAYETYHEPFVGGGALFFSLSAGRVFKRAFLSDSNERLVKCYLGVKNNVGDVIARLKGFRRSRRFYMEMRERNIDRASDGEVAAWFIFMNKMGFNGLYRVNSKNEFNVPFGDNKNAQICDEANLIACHRALENAEINHEDFSTVSKRAKPGDFVYFDPPYKRVSATSYFTSYTAKGFTEQDQERLRNVALELKSRGVRVLLSNSWTAKSLYAGREFDVNDVLAARAVNSRADRRGKITELLIS
jgi:DNA adenine methylase